MKNINILLGKRSSMLVVIFLLQFSAQAQKQNLTIEKLWSLQRLSGTTLLPDGKHIAVTVSTPNVTENKSVRKTSKINIATGEYEGYDPSSWIDNYDNAKLSPDGKKLAFTKEVLLENTIAANKYKDLPKSNAYIFTDLNNRHWDEYEDGKYSHVFIADVTNNSIANEVDIMDGQMYDCPQKPSGGAEDICWSPDSKSVLYVCKKKSGKQYAISTNTDVYAYNLTTKITKDLTVDNMGYDQAPAFSPDGTTLAWVSMRRDGFESDKQDVKIMDWNNGIVKNITANYDETINSFLWSADSKKMYLEIPTKGTIQLYDLDLQNVAPSNRMDRKLVNTNPLPRQITNGIWDVNGIVADAGNNKVVITRSDMNHANELYSVNTITGAMEPLTNINGEAYANINMCKVESKVCKATDGKNLFSWVVYPPNFDPAKKYPVLLYCQGGPQGTISQFYSFRWNFQLMASQGYIVVVPNRRGCQGWGTQWNEAISKDWGGQAINDYLSAFDNIAKEPYVDKKRCGAVGASYGGYSVFMLAGVHNNRFKSFISHDGLFDLRSWYGNTEELWFANFDIGGAYWDKKVASYAKHNPVNLVEKWNTPIMIVQGGKDFRVGIEQGLAAFQTAQLKGIKSKLLYLPEENHWVLKAQNAQVWQREFYSWLAETLPQ